LSLEAPHEALARIVASALAEDLGDLGDITTVSIVPSGTPMTAVIRSREAGRIAGVDAVRLVISRLPEPASATIVTPDGSDVEAGGTVALLSGSARTLLTGERVILNLLGHLSGIATATAAVVRAVEGTGAVIKDTRKTTPGLRLLEKYAVEAGGGINHRSGLYDAVLIKDNHIAVAGSITTAVGRARARLGRDFPIQVEVDTLEQLKEALTVRVDAVLLDNMKPRSAASRRRNREPQLPHGSIGRHYAPKRACGRRDGRRFHLAGLAHALLPLARPRDRHRMTG
jgi:nicotinate-nucleotide pyrophosphorylase (carboxylating)